MFQLRSASPEAWLICVMGDFDSFLVDHAACEQKASANAISLAIHYRDRQELVRAMVDLAREEMEHFWQVYGLLEERGLLLAGSGRDPYIHQLRALIRTGREDYMLDRLLLFGIVEARGCERFGLVRDALEPGSLKEFYSDITRAEARHHGLFVRIARTYFSEDRVQERLSELLDAEAEVVSGLPIHPRLH